MLFGTILVAALVSWTCLVYTRSAYGTRVGVDARAEVPFSHEHHVGHLGIDCRYCHTSVEHSSFAGLPPTKTCMNCHSQIWVGSEVLAPVRDSYRTNTPLKWTGVYNLPGFVYFDHSIHVKKGSAARRAMGRSTRCRSLFRQVAVDGVVPRLPSPSGATRFDLAKPFSA